MNRQTVIDHISDDEMVGSRPHGETIGILDAVINNEPVVYPVIDTWFTGQPNGYLGDPQPTPQLRVWHRVRACCFHDLRGASREELAGMGLALIGNVCQGVAKKTISSHADARLELRLSAAHAAIALPWPGFSNDRQIALDLCALPMDVAMFLHDEDGQFKRRVDRLELMRNIENTWVPFVKSLIRHTF